ncbi:MAG: LOG family protein [Synechococcus lacustris]
MAGPLPEAIRTQLSALAQELDDHAHGAVASRVLETLVQISRSEADAADWETISGTLADMADAFAVFHPHRHTRKVAVFGSARTPEDDPVYRLTTDLAAEAVAAGFEVMTGAGGGVMEAANRGAGPGQSFGLNVQLPFEQSANPYIEGDPRLLTFRYFHTRKLFFLKETDAVVVLPGGFGTLDELFEGLTLIQTAKNPPVPIVLLCPEGDAYWERWHTYVDRALGDRGLISPQDNCLYGTAHSAREALRQVKHFYRVFHSSRFRGEQLQLLLHCPLPEAELAVINAQFSDLVLGGEISRFASLESGGAKGDCLQFWFDQRQMGRLYALIQHLNGLELPPCPPLEHPEQRLGQAA